MSDRTQNQLRRILDMLFLLNDCRLGCTVPDLAKRYEVHKRTITRDLASLAYLMFVAQKDGRWFGIGNKTVESIKKDITWKDVYCEADESNHDHLATSDTLPGSGSDERGRRIDPSGLPLVQASVPNAKRVFDGSVQR
jgi:hypothetical protein